MGGLLPVQTKKVLVVEDEPVTRETLKAYFEKEGFIVFTAEDGEEMKQVLAQDSVDLILLDINLPGEDGLSLMRQMQRDDDVAVILVTAKSDDIDRIVGLELGADDYVTKPFNPRELLARARNVLRRNETHGADPVPAGTSPLRNFDNFSLDLYRRRLTNRAGEQIKLTKGELDLLAAFVQNPGRVLGREELLDLINSKNLSPLDRTIDVMVGRLRRKLEDDPKNPRILVTVHGAGYVLSTEVSS